MRDQGEQSQRNERIKEAIRAKAAEFISSQSNYTSLITVTEVLLSKDKKRSIILVSVLPTHKEDAALDFLKRQRGELRKYINDHVRIGRVPTLDVALDVGEKNRQRIDEISNLDK